MCMSTLYIIGNGFDRAHNLNTSYWHFRSYLEKHAEDFLADLERMYGFQPIDPLDWRTERNWENIKISRDKVLEAKLWLNFETDLGYADENEMLDFSQSVIGDLDLETGPIGIEDTMNLYWEKQYRFIADLQEYVHKWVKQIQINSATIQRQKMYHNCEDFFLTFNYTNVLERIYMISPKHILHIHGGLSPYCNTPPIMGHGNMDGIRKYKTLAAQADEEYDEASKSIYNAIARYYQRSFKDVKRNLKIQNNFFCALGTVDAVEIIGHSLGAVDMPYFQTVKDSIPEQAIWNVYYYRPEEKAIFHDAIASLGVPDSLIQPRPSSEFWDCA